MQGHYNNNNNNHNNNNHSSLHPDFYQTIAASYSTVSVSDQYVVTSGRENFLSGFSTRGSPHLMYPYEDYPFLPDRGAPSCSGLPSTSFNGPTMGFDATGLRFAEASTSGRMTYHPQATPGHYEHGWQWENSQTTQSNMAHFVPTSFPDAAFLTNTIKRTVQQQPHSVRFPTARLATPAAMAVLLNPNGQPVVQQPVSQVPAEAPLSVQPATRKQTSAADAVAPASEVLSREKRHACTMCHKRFDRPSTLRKHLLVHTGEKAFACEACGRRFGVASNLNRHVKRCILKPPRAAAFPTSITSLDRTPAALGTTMEMNAAGAEHRDATNKATTTKRGRAQSRTESNVQAIVLSNDPSLGSEENAAEENASGGQKRRKRGRSPSLWIPQSLCNFNLLCEEYYRATSVPLSPVHRNLPHEERDSWDEGVSSTPYHPCGWKGVLPGPGLGIGTGLGGEDMRDIDFRNSGGIVLGRVMVY